MALIIYHITLKLTILLDQKFIIQIDQFYIHGAKNDKLNLAITIHANHALSSPTIREYRICLIF